MYIIVQYFHTTGVYNCDLQFPTTPEHCLNETVEYQCTVTGSGILAMQWIINNDGTEIGTTGYD